MISRPRLRIICTLACVFSACGLRALAAAPSIEPFRYTVHTGDSASKLAQRWGVPESLIVKPGHVLKVGEVVTIPIVARVKIARGQTLSAISHKYKISIESLAKFNRIPPPYRVRSGKVILVPALE